MKITKIIKTPIFINEYIKLDNSVKLKDELNGFCEYLLSNKPKSYSIKPTNHLSMNYDISGDDELNKFISFCLSKAELDLKYICRYELELDIPKSITNEYYTVEAILDDEDKSSIYNIAIVDLLRNKSSNINELVLSD